MDLPASLGVVCGNRVVLWKVWPDCLLFFCQKQVYPFSDSFRSRHAMRLTEFFQLCFCVSIQPYTKTDILRILRFWPARSGRHLVTSLSVTR